MIYIEKLLVIGDWLLEKRNLTNSQQLTTNSQQPF